MISEVRLDSTLTAPEIQAKLEAALHQPVSVVATGDQGQWMLRYAAPENLEQQPEIKPLLESFSKHVEMLNVSLVGPQVGQELAEQGGLAVLITLLVILAYLSFRFEWRLASGALLALMHDVFILLGFFALTGLEFNLTVLAALLAVLGYSLNDSIIISDRIRELLKANVKLPIAELNNQAILNTLSRTLITSGTTLISVVSLWLLGGEPLYGFSVTMFIGIVAGTWSTMTIATIIPEVAKLGPQHYAPEPISEAP
ncbi:protein-export membrane protein SecF [Vibrio ponticus]|nr:protein-export membrane protein SecF [Vibrio ponticus]